MLFFAQPQSKIFSHEAVLFLKNGIKPTVNKYLFIKMEKAKIYNYKMTFVHIDEKYTN